MKFFISFFILLLIFVISSCVQSSADFFRQSPPEKILEITTDFTGLYWINGQVLNFRLYRDGIVEYDEYSLQKTSYETLNVEKIKIVRQIKINEDEYKEIIAILTNEDFFEIANKITPQKSCIDAFMNTKINFKYETVSKELFIEDHCSTLADSKSTSRLFENFPFKLNELFQKITVIKSRQSSGKFYN